MPNWCVKGFFLAVMLCVSLGATDAAGPKAVRKQAEHSLLVKGNIDVDADGSVAAVTLDNVDTLSDALATYLRDTVKTWRFEPVVDKATGAAMNVRSPLSLRLVARHRDDDGMDVSIASAQFVEYRPDDLASVVFDQVKPPLYPDTAVRSGVGGDVYVGVKVGRDGRVEDVSTQRVNLNVVTDERSMAKWRAVLAKASESAIRKWTFRVPTEGEIADAPYWVVQVPVSFQIAHPGARAKKDDAIVWKTYIPGPVQPLPWVDPADVRNAMPPDAFADGGVYLARQDGLRLLTPLAND